MRHLFRPLAVLSLLLVTLPARSAVRYLPGAAETPGQGGAFFSSTLVLSNTSTSPMEATVSLIPPRETTTPVPAPVTLTLQAGETRRVDAVLQTLFAASHPFGTLKIEGGVGLLSDLRTLNVSDPAGTYGVGLPPVDEAALLSVGETGYASWVEQSADAARGYRTNVSLTLVAPGTSVELRILDATGTLRGTTTVSSGQPGVYQARIADLVSPGALEVGHVEIRVLAGKAFGGTIVNDNVTSDAIAVPAERSPGGATDLLLPGVAYTNGALGTFWSSDLRLFNPGASPVTVTVGTVGIAAPPVPPLVRTLEAGAVLSIPHVLEAFSLPLGVAGALRVRAPSPVLAAARTSNIDPTGVRPGTLAGQVLPVILPEGLLPAGSTGTFAGLDQSTSVPGVRTNLALVGGPAGSTGILVLRDASSGSFLASASYSIGAGEWLQRNLGEWFPSAPGASSTSSAKAELLAFPAGSRVDVVPSTGSLTAYVSRVDNGTGDPIVRPLARVEEPCPVEPFQVEPFSTSVSPAVVGSPFLVSWGLTRGGLAVTATRQRLVVDADVLPLAVTDRSASVTLSTPGAHTLLLHAEEGCRTVERTLTLFACSPLTIGPDPLPGATVGQPYSTRLVSGSVAPLAWQSLSPLPAGLTLNPSTGTISGTPQAPGTTVLILRVLDANGCAGAASIPLVVSCPTLVVSPASVAPGQVGTAYGPVSFTVTGANGTVTWAATGLPGGLALTPAGVLSGTPTAAGTFNVVVTATDAAGCSGSVTVGLRVCPVIALAPTTLPQATASVAYSQQLTASSGAPATYVFAVTAGTLPAGITLSAAGLLAGIPTVTGSFPVTVTATDSNGCAGSLAYTLVVACPVPQPQPASPAHAVAGTAYSQQLTSSAGVAPFTFAVTAGALPAGVTLSAAGLLSGTPTVTGSFPVTVEVTDANGCKGSALVTVVVDCPTITPGPASPAHGVAGIAYSQQLTVAGGIAPYTFARTAGTLPAGVTLSAAGLLSGTPTVTGSFPITVEATDANGCKGSALITVVVDCPTITVTTTTLPAGVAGVTYAGATLASSGGVGTITWTVTSGSLPAGTGLSAAGVLSGVPTQTGSFNFTATATDANLCTGQKQLTLVVACATIAVGPASPAGATEGAAYSQTFTQAGGLGTVAYSVTSGSLPGGLTLSTAGVLSGIPDAGTAGLYSFTVTAMDQNGCSGFVAVTLRVCPVITVTPATLASGLVNSAYGPVVFAASGTAVAPVSFAVSAGTLPDGLTLAADGTLSGIPTAVGSSTFTVKVTDANGCSGTVEVTLSICPVITVTPATLAPATATVFTSQQLAASSGAPATYVFAVTAGTLPSGITLSADGLLSGTTAVTGSFPITVTATDGNGCTGSRGYTFVVACPTLQPQPASPAHGIAGTTYSQQLTSSAGVAPFTFAATAGTLPAGITLSSSGLLSGTPTVTGSFPVTVEVTDANGCKGSALVTVVVDCPTITPGPASPAHGVAGTAYSQQMTATGGIAPYTFTKTGALPAGVTLSAAGLLSGTPTATGSFPIIVEATDANGCKGTVAVTVVVDCPTITVTTTTLPAGVAGVAYAGATLASTGGVGTITWTVTSGSLPAGMGLSAAGVLSGVPTQTGSFPITVTATDANLCTGQRQLTLVVACATIAVGPASPAGATEGAAYSQTFTQSGGLGTVAYSVTSGSLPGGLTLSTAGVLSGTPDAGTAGLYSFTVTAVDQNGCSGFVAVTLRVCPVIAVTPATLASGLVNSAYGPVSFVASGTAVAPVSFTVSAGTLPAGLTLAADGTLSGIPTAVGSSTFTVKATDANGCSGTVEVTLRICPVITATPTSLAQATAGTAYGPVTFSATGAGATPAWSVTGTLPNGITFSGGVLSGTATQVGFFPLTVTATDANGCTGSVFVTLTVLCPTITVTNPSVVTATAGFAFSQSFTQSGAIGTVTWTIASGTLPPGMSLNTSNGLLSGKPTVTGNYTFAVTATDANGCTGTGATYSLLVTCPTITVTTSSLPNGQYLVPYGPVSFAQSGSGGTSLTWSSTPLPAGLVLTPAGSLSGTPTTTTGVAVSITFTVTDEYGCSGSRTLSLQISPVAVAETISGAVGNTQLVLGAVRPTTPNVFVAGSVLSNDSGPAPLSAVAGTFATTNGGSVTISSNGTFVLSPATGSVASDTFTYTLRDANTATATGTVTVQFSGRVWYVNAATGTALATGRSHDPFSSLDKAATPSLAGDTIFVHSGASQTTTTGALALKANQLLWGQGTAYTLGNLSIAATTKPRLTGTVTLASGVTVSSLDISTTNATALTDPVGAITGVTVTNSVVVSANGGTAILLSDVDASTLSFVSVSANAASGTSSNGISLTNVNATSGAFTVAGTGTAGSGGTIRNTVGGDGSTAGSGIWLQNVKGVSLSRMQLDNHQNFAIRGQSVTNFAMADSVVNGANGTNTAFREGSVVFDNLFGASSITNSTVQGGVEDNLRVENTSGTLTLLTVTGCTIGNNSSATGNIGVRVAGSGTAVMTATVATSTFQGNRTIAIDSDAGNTATVNFTASGNTIVAGTGGNPQGNQGIEVSASGTATLNYTIDNNKVGTDALTDQPLLNTGINVFAGTSSTLSGTVVNNIVANAGAGFSGFGIRVFQSETSSLGANVTGNTVRNVALDYGILAEGSGSVLPASGTLRVGLSANNVQVLGTALDAVRVQARGNNTVCARIASNTTSAGGAGFFGLFLRQVNTSTFRVEGLTTGVQTAATTIAYEQGQNPAAATVSATAATGFTGVVPNTCGIP